VLEYCDKGTQVSVQGTLETRKYAGDDGVTRKETRIIATWVGFGYTPRREETPQNTEETVSKTTLPGEVTAAVALIQEYAQKHA
ncbi:MAG TPA: hypothetical protein ENI23_00075, partial [bacterium]|nr:hypothetical protein [bacterium]